METSRCVLAAICLLVALGHVASAPAEKPSGPDSNAAGLTGLAVKFKVTEPVSEVIPFLVNVLNNVHTHSCTGALIAPNVVLAPASCVNSTGGTSVVRANSNQVQGEGPEEQQELLPACKKIVHSGFTGKPEDGNDIALIILGVNASCPENRLPKLESVADCPAEQIELYGWFAPTKQSGPTEYLECVQHLKHVPEVCKDAFPKLSPAPICMKTDPTQQVTWGLGALLTCNAEKLIGVMTGTLPDKASSIYDVTYVYTSAQGHHDWIKGALDQACGCDGQSVVYVNGANKECKSFVVGNSDDRGSCTENDTGFGWCKVNDDGEGSCKAVNRGGSS